MTLDLSANEEYVGLPASVALAAAMFEQTGLRELIDSRFNLDPRQKLSPGNAIKALIGDMVGSRGRSALFNVSYKYMAAPNDLLFGRKVDVKALGGTAFSRDLDRLYDLNLPGLSYGCYSKLASFYGLKSNVFNVDSTNFSITALSKEPDGDAALPERPILSWTEGPSSSFQERWIRSSPRSSRTVRSRPDLWWSLWNPKVSDS